MYQHIGRALEHLGYQHHSEQDGKWGIEVRDAASCNGGGNECSQKQRAVQGITVGDPAPQAGGGGRHPWPERCNQTNAGTTEAQVLEIQVEIWEEKHASCIIGKVEQL